MSTPDSSAEFGAFCDFVLALRDQTGETLTPEESVARFRAEQEKLRVWHERNRISQEQADRGEARPLDLDELLAEVEAEVAPQSTSGA